LRKKGYTVLIVSQKAAQVKKLILSPFALKIGIGLLAVIVLVTGYLVYENIQYKRKLAELQQLRVETNAQQSDIRSFMGKITLLEEQLTKLKEMEMQMKEDLREINELKKAKKAVPLVFHQKKTSPVKSKEKEEVRRVAQLREEQVSILDKERPRLVSRLHQDLLELRREAWQREQNLKELHDFLQSQKSVLLSIPYLWPVLGRISSGFGENRSSASAGARVHKGVDISATSGTPIVAPADGIVTFAGRESEYGRLVTIDHGNGFSTAYGHLQEILIQAGEKIKKGQPLGTVGTSGNTTGPHLHYEVRIQGNPVDPARYMNQS
jgi:murein DD-endopeptidase MepM/ murein hydrolase activator NlpD